MERLTERKTSYPSCDKNGNLERVDYIEIKDKSLAEEKLVQLEDVEDELKVDLTILFKALKNGCFAKETFDYMGKKQTQIIFTEFTQLYYADDLDDYLIHIRTRDYYLKDYGKTWALTKEELENEQKRKI